MCGLLERSKTVCEGPSPEKPIHNAQGRPGKCCGGGGYLSTGNPPPKIDEAVFVGYRLNIGCGAQIRQVGVRFELCCYGCSNGIYNCSMGIARKCADDFDPGFDLGVACVDDPKRCNSLHHQGKRRAHILRHCKFSGSSVPCPMLFQCFLRIYPAWYLLYTAK